jgi:polyribonucleotide nucleotidyltransferase
MISDITAVPEAGKTYLGKVVRLAEFGAFVEIFPGTDGLLHVSEIAEHRVKEVKDELREGDQILVKVIALEGNRIKLSRKAVLREQREKLGLPPVAEQSGGGERSERGERSSSSEPRRERERSPRPDRDRDRGPRPERNEPRSEQPKPQETIVLDSEAFDDEDEDFEGDDEGTEETAVTTPADGSAPAAGAPAGQRRGRRRRGRRPGAPASTGESN